jgi:hypothetical protein
MSKETHDKIERLAKLIERDGVEAVLAAAVFKRVLEPSIPAEERRTKNWARFVAENEHTLGAACWLEYETPEDFRSDWDFFDEDGGVIEPGKFYLISVDYIAALVGPFETEEQALIHRQDYDPGSNVILASDARIKARKGEIAFLVHPDEDRLAADFT